MPGVASAVIGTSATANTQQEVFVPKGNHVIHRIGDLNYAPAGLSNADAWITGAATLETTGGEFAIWQNDDFSALDHYGSTSFTGAPTFNVYHTDTNRPFAFWVVPDNHYWRVTDFVLGSYAGTAGDLGMVNVTMIGGSSTEINQLATGSDTFFDANSVTGSWIQYLARSSEWKALRGPIFDKAPPKSGIIAMRHGTDNAAGYQYLNYRLMVEEIPVIGPSIEITIPGRTPVRSGARASFSLPTASKVKFTSNISGVYAIDSE